MEKYINETSITEDCIYNLDEVDATLVMDFQSNTLSKRLMTREKQVHMEIIERSYDHRTTMMPVVSEIGKCVPPLSVFKASITYRTVIRDGKYVTKVLSLNLPPCSWAATRYDLGGVDSINFLY